MEGSEFPQCGHVWATPDVPGQSWTLLVALTILPSSVQSAIIVPV